MCDNPEFDTAEQSSTGRAKSDRPGDPLFPIMPHVLEALRTKAAERARSADAGGAAARAPLDDYAAVLETICGAVDDSQPVEMYDGTLGVSRAFVDTHQRAVGQIQWNDNLASIYTNPGNVSGVRWCSGTLVSDDLFLTAGHCFDQTGGGWQRPRVNGTSNVISSAEIAQNMHVNFNFQVDPSGNPRPVSAFPITALIEYRLGGLDFAVIRLGGNPGATWGRTALSATDANTGEMLCIMGHPEGVPKRVEAGPALPVQGNQIRYDDIDTRGGNSGSGVLRASDGRIVGVHTNGGCGPSSPNGGDANFGMRIAAVIAASPTLQALARPSVKAIDDGVVKRKVVDDHASLKFRDDGGPKLKFTDDGGTFKFADDGGKLKALDDVKSPVLDGRPPFDPGGPVVNPRAGGTARPFVLSTPHHSMAWAGQEARPGQAADAYEAALHELGEAIAQQYELLQALDAQFRQLYEEYRHAVGGGGARG